MKQYLIYILTIALCMGCGSAKKTNFAAEKIAAFKAFIENEPYEFEARAAFPLQTQAVSQVTNSGILQPGSNSGRIDLINNTGYIKVFEDSVAVDLPYFGERRVAGGYNSDTGISFNGKPSKYYTQYDSLKTKYVLELQLKNRTEVFDLTIEVFPTKNTNVNITSSHRSSIRYQGAVQEIRE